MSDEEFEPLRGKCVICGERTDQSIGVYAPAEVPIALLVHLGGVQKEVTRRIADYAVVNFGCDPGMVPSGDETWRFLVCEDCAQPMREDVVAALVAAGVPFSDVANALPVEAPPNGRSR